jgi:hypothetical protein
VNALLRQKDADQMEPDQVRRLEAVLAEIRGLYGTRNLAPINWEAAADKADLLPLYIMVTATPRATRPT